MASKRAFDKSMQFISSSAADTTPLKTRRNPVESTGTMGFPGQKIVIALQTHTHVSAGEWNIIFQSFGAQCVS